MRIRFRNRLKIFRWLYMYLDSSPKIKFGIFLGLLFPLIYLLIRLTYTDRIKVIILDHESDIESSSPQGRWNIDGWDFITDTFHSVFQKNKISTRGFQKEAENGLWLSSKKTAAGDSLTFVLDNFQYHYPVETTVGVRFYIAGSGKLEIVFRDSFLWETNTYVIIPNHQPRSSTSSQLPAGEDSEDHSLFCSHIVPLCFDGLVDKVEIKATFESDDAFVVIDSVFVTMGKHGGSRNLMLTMMPSNWCTKEYLYNWSPNEPESTNFLKRRNVMSYR